MGRRLENVGNNPDILNSWWCRDAGGVWFFGSSVVPMLSDSKSSVPDDYSC